MAAALEAVLKRDRAVVIGGLGLVIALSWFYILAGAGMGMTAVHMTGMTGPNLFQTENPRAGGAKTPSAGAIDMSGEGMAAEGMPGAAGEGMAAQHMSGMVMEGMRDMAGEMMTPAAWTLGYAILMFFMWWIMMIAMMLPSAAPMILLYALVHRRNSERLGPYLPTTFFALGYLAAWAAFSLLAVALQWGFERAGLLSSAMSSASFLLGGGLLIAAGLYQLTPIKHACLRHCRAPVRFLSSHWRAGRAGALRMGVEHGAFCLGCCWVLMGLLFVGGVMNLYWIGGLAAFVLLEKTVPAGHWLACAIGIGLVLWGGAFLLVAI